MKKLIFVFGLIFWQVGLGQIDKFAIGSKWIYNIYPCIGEPYYDTLLSEKDTTINAFTMRKVKNVRTNENYLFVLSSTGIMQYSDDTLRMIYPLGIALNDVVEVDIPFAFTVTVSGNFEYVEKFKKFYFKCTEKSNVFFENNTVTNYKISILTTSLVGVNSSSLVYFDIDYNNLFGNTSYSFLPLVINLGRFTCGYETFVKYDNGIYKYQNAQWNRSSVTGINAFEKHNLEFEIYPNPTNDLIIIKSKETLSDFHYSIYSFNGILFKTGVIDINQVIDISRLIVGEYILVLEDRYKNKSINKITKK